jgi:cytoskeletal protein RodZ
VFEIGNSLREARVRQGLDLTDVERATKIRPKYLRALEDEQFEILPAQTYVKGFLSTYAEFLGLDGQLYVDEFNSRYVTRDEEVFRPRRSNAGRKRNRRLERIVVLAALAGIATVFALVIAAWNSGDDSPRTTTPVAEPDLRSPAEPTLVVRATRGATGMEVHRSSQQGPLVWAGTVPHGRSQSFKLTVRLWMYVQRPRVVDLVAAGRTTRAPARRLLVDASGVQRAPTAR